MASGIAAPGQAARMNRAMKEATIKTFRGPGPSALRVCVLVAVTACNLATHPPDPGDGSDGDVVAGGLLAAGGDAPERPGLADAASGQMPFFPEVPVGPGRRSGAPPAGPAGQDDLGRAGQAAAGAAKGLISPLPPAAC
jgi:hypothetical protein